MKVVLLPVKDLASCKERLSTRLSPAQRSQLMWTLYRRTARIVQQAQRSPAADVPASSSEKGRREERFRVAVVTADGKIAEHAGGLGWRVLREQESVSESRSVDWASRRLQAEGALSVLRLPCDLPLLLPQDVVQLWEVSRNLCCVLAPCRSGHGTNALLRVPPDAFPSRFGPHSRSRHQQEAARQGCSLRIVENPRLALDIDRPDDIEFFLGEAGGDCEVARLLSSWVMKP